jgi:DNA-binding winged helix-turn-helix (wHTH) protein
MSILELLVGTPSTTISREEFQKNPSKDVDGGEFQSAMDEAIRKLRAVLGDPEIGIISTAPRRGYRLIAKLGEAEPAEAIAPIEVAQPVKRDFVGITTNLFQSIFLSTAIFAFLAAIIVGIVYVLWINPTIAALSWARPSLKYFLDIALTCNLGLVVFRFYRIIAATLIDLSRYSRT